MTLEKVTEFDYPVVDMDCHIFEPPEIFTEYLNPAIRERASQVLQEEQPFTLGLLAQGQEWFMFHTEHGAKYRMHCETEEAADLNAEDPSYMFPGWADGEIRLWCMDQEGIDCGIVRNTLMAGMFSLKDIELVNALCQAYNDWVYDFCSVDLNRLLPEALLPCADMDLAVKELERTAAKGFRGTVVAGSTPGPPLSDPHWDPLFSRLQEMGWPLCVHSAFNMNVDSAAQWLLNGKEEHPVSGGAFWSILINLNFMLDNIVTIGEMTLGGMCDKFPNLNIYFIEAGHSWIGEVLYRLDKSFAVPPVDFGGWQRQAKTKPSEIFERQLYVPFEGGDQHYMADMSFDALSKNLVWASDIPHWDADGPWEGAGAMRALKVSKDVERMVMGGNGAKLLGIPHQKLVGTSARAKAPVAV